MTNELNTNEQANMYVIIYSCGKQSQIYINASNIKDACTEAKKREREIGSSHYKVKRCYNGGVRG
jgi:hypothetical protein